MLREVRAKSAASFAFCAQFFPKVSEEFFLSGFIGSGEAGRLSRGRLVQIGGVCGCSMVYWARLSGAGGEVIWQAWRV